MTGRLVAARFPFGIMAGWNLPAKEKPRRREGRPLFAGADGVSNLDPCQGAEALREMGRLETPTQSGTARMALEIAAQL